MKKHYRKENNCLNCGTTLQGKYCHNCGQENLEIKESFGHMMNHAISDYFHFDHQFFHTLKPLLFKPGYLTNEYMAGRRAQYLHPVKMYIFISIVYFLLLFQSGHNVIKINGQAGKANTEQQGLDSVNKQIMTNPNLSASAKRKIIANEKDINSGAFNFSGDSTISQYNAAQARLPESERDKFFERKIIEKLITYNAKYGARAKEVFLDELRHNIPKLMFLLLPLLALILRVTFFKSKKFYVEHLIYAFHLHCFIFLFFGILLILQMFIPSAWRVMDWIMLPAWLYSVWYTYRSLRVVYHRSKIRTITKMTGMFLAYSTVALTCFVLLVLFTAFAA
jgi:hypothetical protein